MNSLRFDGVAGSMLGEASAPHITDVTASWSVVAHFRPWDTTVRQTIWATTNPTATGQYLTMRCFTDNTNMDFRYYVRNGTQTLSAIATGGITAATEVGVWLVGVIINDGASSRKAWWAHVGDTTINTPVEGTATFNPDPSTTVTDLCVLRTQNAIVDEFNADIHRVTYLNYALEQHHLVALAAGINPLSLGGVDLSWQPDRDARILPDAAAVLLDPSDAANFFDPVGILTPTPDAPALIARLGPTGMFDSGAVVITPVKAAGIASQAADAVATATIGVLADGTASQAADAVADATVFPLVVSGAGVSSQAADAIGKVTVTVFADGVASQAADAVADATLFETFVKAAGLSSQAADAVADATVFDTFVKAAGESSQSTDAIATVLRTVFGEGTASQAADAVADATVFPLFVKAAGLSSQAADAIALAVIGVRSSGSASQATDAVGEGNVDDVVSTTPPSRRTGSPSTANRIGSPGIANRRGSPET